MMPPAAATPSAQPAGAIVKISRVDAVIIIIIAAPPPTTTTTTTRLYGLYRALLVEPADKYTAIAPSSDCASAFAARVRLCRARLPLPRASAFAASPPLPPCRLCGRALAFAVAPFVGQSGNNRSKTYNIISFLPTIS
jgi:hypothetical protein